MEKKLNSIQKKPFRTREGITFQGRFKVHLRAHQPSVHWMWSRSSSQSPVSCNGLLVLQVLQAKALRTAHNAFGVSWGVLQSARVIRWLHLSDRSQFRNGTSWTFTITISGQDLCTQDSLEEAGNQDQTAPFCDLWWHLQMTVVRITVTRKDRWQASIFALRKARSFCSKRWQGFQLVSSWFRRTLYCSGLLYPSK